MSTLRWHRKEPGHYTAKGQEAQYYIERMRYENTSRIVWVVTINGSCPEALKSLSLAKASAQTFENSYATEEVC